jgi:hypothetical protein
VVHPSQKLPTVHEELGKEEEEKKNKVSRLQCDQIGKKISLFGRNFLALGAIFLIAQNLP